MALLLTETSDFLFTETTSAHLLIEPVTVSAGSFPTRFGGVAVIYKISDFWELDIGQGPIRSTRPDMLEQIALNAGASKVKYG